MFRESKLSKFLIVSGVLHILIALVMSRIYAEQPQRHRSLEIKSAVRIQYEEPEPPPKPKPVIKPPPKKIAPKKKKPEPEEKPKVTPQKVTPPKVTRQRRRMSASAPSLGTGNAPQQSRIAPGIAGIKGARGPVNELPTASSASGIENPNVTTKTGGTGLAPGRTHGSMKMPTGTSDIPGSGGKEIAGFRMGSSGTGSGVGEADISGSGGRGGKSDEGPGSGLASHVSRINTGGGKGTTGLGVGSSDGMAKVGVESTGSKPGDGRGAPGTGGHQSDSSRSAPSLTTAVKPNTGKGKELPATKNIPEEKRDGATGKKEFKTGAKTDMTKTDQSIGKPEESDLEDVLQSEINRNLHGLRKMYEDWQNLKIPDIPKVLQITVELGAEKGKPKLLKVDLHKSGISSRIKDDLTKKIKTWEFKSLFDGEDDPKKWPIKLSGKISWQ